MKKQFIQLIFIPFFLLSLVPSLLTGETGKAVRVASLCFVSGSQSVKNIAAIIDQQGEKGIDLVCLPEAWTGSAESMQGETVLTISALAKKHHCYICCPIIVKREGKIFNSAILFDRDGNVGCVYDKIYPYWSELRKKNPVTPAQKDVVVYDTDFGRIGFLICYDAKFPEVWRRLRDEGAELVVWPSAYSADTELQAYALLHHYYIVTSTWTNDCIVWDISGKKLLDQKSANPVHVSRFRLDMDRQIYHYNFNMDKRRKLLKERGNEVMIEIDMPREEWFVLKAIKEGISARKLGIKYGLETLRDYTDRSRAGIDEIRGFEFSKKFGGYPGGIKK